MKEEEKVYLKFVDHLLEYLENQIPAEVMRKKWEIVQRKSVDKNGTEDSSTVFVFPGFDGQFKYKLYFTLKISSLIRL